MGELTREVFRLEIDKNLGSRARGLAGADLTAYEDRLNRHIRLAELRIARGRSLQELNYSDSVAVPVTGTPATDAYFSTFPQNWKDIYSLRWQDGSQNLAHKLTYVPPRQWDQLFGLPYTITTGIPKWYTVSKTSGGLWQLEFHPAPNQASTLFRRYSVWPTAMALDTDTSTFEYMDDLIIAWATEWMFGSSGEIEDEDRWRKKRAELLGGIILEDAERPDVSVTPLMASDLAGDRGIRSEEDPFNGLPGYRG